MPPSGKPFAKGDDPRRNAGGRPAIPDEVKEALKGLTLPAVARLGKLLQSENEDIALRAVLGVLDRNLGKALQGLFVAIADANPTPEPVTHEPPDAKQLAATLAVLHRVDRIPHPERAGVASGGADAEVDAVHPAPAAPDAAGLPPP